MEKYTLDFELPIAQLEAEIIALQNLNPIEKKALDKIASLEHKLKDLKHKTYKNLSSLDIVKLARHQNRPQGNDYIGAIVDDFVELKGDRVFGDDNAVITGIGKIDGIKVAIIASVKGRGIKERLDHNFGMISPEGYNKALRVMKLAEKFNIPVISLIDVPGAYPGISAEERNQSFVIANNIAKMSSLKTPIIATIIGEGGSGGALSIGVGDIVNMLEYSIYSVISPEGCASILWKDAKKADIAAEHLGLRSEKLLELNLIDAIIKEPVGGAHLNPKEAFSSLKEKLIKDLNQLKEYSPEKIAEMRYNKILNLGY